MTQYSIQALCQGAKIDTQKSFSQQEVGIFIALHEQILLGDSNEQIQELYKKWSVDTFHTLLEMLCFLGKSQTLISVTAPTEHPNLSPIINIMREDIFGKNSLEGIFYKFIQRKAVMNADIDYGYSQLEKSRYANLSDEWKTAYEKSVLFTNSEDILRIGNKHSPERTRRERKTAMDAMLTGLIKDPNLRTSEFFSIFSGAYDMALKSEKQRNIDNEYGSHHHILYGMINGDDDFVVEPWLNPHSQFQYLCFVVPLFRLLSQSR